MNIRYVQIRIGIILKLVQIILTAARFRLSVVRDLAAEALKSL